MNTRAADKAQLLVLLHLAVARTCSVHVSGCKQRVVDTTVARHPGYNAFVLSQAVKVATVCIRYFASPRFADLSRPGPGGIMDLKKIGWHVAYCAAADGRLRQEARPRVRAPGPVKYARVPLGTASTISKD